ncbi:hypothetical protein [Chlamydia vaughanii]|uniref:hypothetical protein n=1 Tax=Chlamydia vaughanii TaxID=3112552 RepID=UPI0032B21CE5
MSVSRISGDDPTNSGVGRIQVSSSVSQGNKVELPAIASLRPEDLAMEKRTFSHSVGLLAGLIVFAVAIIVVVVALNCIAPGVPQGIVLAVALAGVSLGGFTVMKNIVNKVRDIFSPKMSEKARIKSAVGIGLGFTGLGLAMKVGAGFVPGGYGAVVGNLGGSASAKGSQSGLASLTHYLYVKFFRSEKAASGEPLTRLEIMQEAKKLHRISLSLLVIGAGFAILGVALAVSGSIFLGGAPAAALIILAPPLISIGVSIVLQTLLHSSIGKWKSFLSAQKGQLLFAEFDLKNIRNEKLADSEVADEKEITIVKREGEDDTIIEESTAEQPVGQREITAKRITHEEIDRRLSLTSRQKVIFALSILLLIAGVAAVISSGFLGMTALQVLLVASVGSAVASTVLPMASSGLVYNIFQMKSRFRITRFRRQEAREKANFIKQLPKDATKIYTKQEIDRAWRLVGKEKIIETEYSISKELADFEKGRGVDSVIVAGIFIACGIGIMLFSLIPVLAPVIPGILGIGSTLVAIGAGMYLKKLTAWLYANLVKLRNRLHLRRAYLADVTGKLELPTDIVIDASADFTDAGSIDGGGDEAFGGAFAD